MIRIDAPDADCGFGAAERKCESESAGSRRGCCAGRVVRKVSAGMQAGTIVAASTEELLEWLDWWWQPVVDCSGVVGLAQEESMQRVAQRGAARRHSTTSVEPSRARMRCLKALISLLYPECGERELFFGTGRLGFVLKVGEGFEFKVLRRPSSDALRMTTPRFLASRGSRSRRRLCRRKSGRCG